MKEVEEELKGLIKTIQELKELVGCKQPNALLWKRVEDGILDNIHKANDYQRNQIINNYPFKFYGRFNRDKDSLKSLIKHKIREDRLKKLLDEN